MSPQPAHFVGESLKKFFIPRSVTKTRRKEIGDESGDQLMIRKYEKNAQGDWECNGEEGTLPPDLQGYVFIVGALFQDEDKPLEYGTPVYTGDGMIYRLGFEQGKAFLKTRIAKTPVIMPI
jgi:carotenoid cleavage dioxygenase-like enzyme